MEYEVRDWYADAGCLYTDDTRVKDLALRSDDLRIVASYFHSTRDVQPFAWDIVGPRDRLTGISRQFAGGQRRAARR